MKIILRSILTIVVMLQVIMLCNSKNEKLCKKISKATLALATLNLILGLFTVWQD